MDTYYSLKKDKKHLIFSVLVLLSNFVLFSNATIAQNIIEKDSLRIIEKVYLHTDRNIYFSGDDIWFKAYLIDASYRLLTSNSNNLHVELISPSSKIVEDRIIRLEDGLGNGDFKLQKDIPSGRYRLRAYTNYMRNFNDQLFFNKELVIISSSDKRTEIEDSIQYVRNKIDIRFFPEGGSLVDDISSVIAFKAVNTLGLGCEVTGEIFSSTGELVADFKSSHLGMGKFSLKPAQGLNYYAIVKTLNGEVARADIPKSFSTGVTFSYSKSQNGRPVIIVNTNTSTLPLLHDNELLLTISARKAILKTIRFKLKSLSNRFTLPVDDIPDGIAMLTLFASSNLPLAERLLFLQQQLEVNLKVETDKAEYKQREPVTINISLLSDSTIRQEANLSLSATEDLSSDSAHFPTTISSWFFLESDVSGSVEEPSYYFDYSNPNRLNDLDLLLLTQGWRDFKWKYDSTGNYPPEHGFTVSGRVKKLFSNTPVPNSNVSIGLLTDNQHMFTSISTDSIGTFSLKGFDFTGNAKLMVNTLGNKKRFQGIILLDSIRYSPAKVQYSTIQKRVLKKDVSGKVIQEALVNESIKKKYRLSDTIQLDEIIVFADRPNDISEPNVISGRYIYVKPDYEIKITGYLESYQSIAVAIQGRVPVFILGGEIYLRGIGTHSNFGSSNVPLYLLDGVPTDLKRINSMPLTIIDRIDVLTSASQTSKFGMRGSNGVISVITKSGIKATRDEPSKYSNTTMILGYNAPRIFYSPQYNKDEMYTPDLRKTLYWQPNIKLGKNKNFPLNFFNADKPSTIKILVEGITTYGIPIVGKAEYKVK